MEKKTHVGLIYGGRSPEHEVSIASAKNVFGALAPERYRTTPIWIDRDGRWHVEEAASATLHNSEPVPSDPAHRTLLSPANDGAELLTGRWTPNGGAAKLTSLGLDVAFPMLHGPNGEDGRIQGLFRMLDLPFVGADEVSSAACMDKEITKRLLRDAGLSIVPFHVLRSPDELSFQEATETLGPTLFVKPASSGSSIGTSKAADATEYRHAVTEAFKYDNKVIVETAISGREIECSVLGNEEPRVAVPGEIIVSAEFYTYDAKYTDEEAAHMDVPADLPNDVSDRVQSLAAETYRVLGCEGMARVDFFLTEDHELLINEVNTIPGFTERSMFPVMWEHTGLPLEDLVDTLIQLGLDRYERDARLNTTP